MDIEAFEHLVCLLLDDRSARIVVLVHAVAETHQAHAILAILDLPDEGLDSPTGGVDALEHLQHRLIRSAVQRTEQGVDAGRDRREHVGVGRTDQPHRGRRTVLLVIGMQHQQHVEHLGHDRVHLVRLGRDPERHAQIVADVVERVVRVDVGLAHRLLVGVGRDRRQLRQQPDGRDLDLLGIQRIQGVLIERGQRTHRAGQHRHRVSVAREPVEQPAQVLVQHGVPLDPANEVVQLGLGGQLAVDQQVGHLEVGGTLGQLFDRVAAVTQDADVAVDVGDLGLARRSVREPDIQRDVTGRLEQLADVQTGTSVRRRHDR